MPGRRFWIIAASLSLTVAAIAAEPLNPLAKAGAEQPNISADSFAPEEGGKVVVATNGHLETKEATIDARKIRFDYRTGMIIAEGDVVYATKSLRIIGEKIEADPRNDTIVATNVRFGRKPVYFTAETLKIVKGDKTMRGLRMWNSEPERTGMHLTIAQATYVESEDRLRIRSVTPHLAGIPFFNLPYYAQDGYRDIPYDLYLNTGSEDRQGRYLRSTFLMRQNPSLWVGGLLDIYGKSGLLVGPAFRYDNKRQPEGGVTWKGQLESGFIGDRGDLLDDVYGRTPGRQRSFLLGEVNGRSVDGVEFAGNVFAQSDPGFMRDFRPNLIRESGNPQANFEVSAPYAGGYLSAALTGKTDDYQDIVQKLPELRFDLPSQSIDESDWNRRSFVSLGYFSERPSADLPLANFQAATLAGGAWSTARLDAYYGVNRTFALGDWLTFRPVAGARVTGWSQGINGNGTTTKVIAQTGFDLEALATGSWDYVGRKWGIDGLRHSIRPVLQYRVMPGADREIGTVPMTQRAVTASALEEVDLADRLDPAATTDRQVVRFGLRNSVETRDAKAGTRELLRADFFADWREGPTDAETGRSDLHCAITLTPAPWVSIGSGLRLPNGGGAPLESIQTIAFNSGDFWRTSVSWVELREATLARQLIWEGRLTLNSVYSLVAVLNYDALAGQTTYESVGVIQRIANSWELEYGVMQRLDPLNNGKSSLGFQLRARLFKF
jgi:LPS-assembly protein